MRLLGSEGVLNGRPISIPCLLLDSDLPWLIQQGPASVMDAAWGDKLEEND